MWIVKDRDAYLLEAQVLVTGVTQTHWAIPQPTHDRREAARFESIEDARIVARLCRHVERGEGAQWRVVRLVPKKKDAPADWDAT